eukprot:6214500-Pleurochrysis_carterae.AAC.13
MRVLLPVRIFRSDTFSGVAFQRAEHPDVSTPIPNKSQFTFSVRKGYIDKVSGYCFSILSIRQNLRTVKSGCKCVFATFCSLYRCSLLFSRTHVGSSLASLSVSFERVLTVRSIQNTSFASRVAKVVSRLKMLLFALFVKQNKCTI